ncbi:adenylate/guanylate cyclase domain-containing protein [Azospirillum halopraeferens]|uniref:adenylate/guanylate cyclase domain-containing protein n=1 Tax=Azospirillum halopraeferens TaxID=34010 RepID=UPI0004028F65|nr:adenylate/guanylate cyclase domain-containing protein [Azospirillum halopraeferens]
MRRLTLPRLPDRPAPAPPLPERVRAAIREQEAQSEILIGWVQLGVVATFGTLYAVAPKTFDRTMTMFEPVPVALAAYLAFTLLRLGLAYRRRLAPWFLYLSVAVDVGLLMGLIWSFHVQYAQPPSFYLKAPTLLYVFIFVALRALRFDPAFVLTAGLAAAAGWAAMVAYAIAAGSDGMVTRNYIEYLTGNKILLGAEFDKIVTILVVTAILAAALARGRRLLERAVAEGAAARDLSRFFAPAVAARITGAEQPVAAGQGDLRDAAILMVDLRGFTRMAAGMDPAAVIALLTEYQARMVPLIARHGGSVDKFMGDGILASFGAVTPVPSYAADAVRAVEALLAEADAWAADRTARGLATPTVNAAVATGRVLFGAVGDAGRLEYTVIGDAVNLAAKLEKHNKAAGSRALATDAAVRLALAGGYRGPAADRPPLRCRVEGMAEPLDLRPLESVAKR